MERQPEGNPQLRCTASTAFAAYDAPESQLSAWLNVPPERASDHLGTWGISDVEPLGDDPIMAATCVLAEDGDAGHAEIPVVFYRDLGMTSGSRYRLSHRHRGDCATLSPLSLGRHRQIPDDLHKEKRPT
jgi:hypothetical protein